MTKQGNVGRYSLESCIFRTYYSNIGSHQKLLKFNFLYKFNLLMHNVPKMVRHTLKILQQMQQDFLSVSDHFGTLCIKGLNSDLIES